MWRLERNTARRGLSGVPCTFLRTRKCRRWRAVLLSFTLLMSPSLVRPTSSLGSLPGLAAHGLTGVAHSFALVGLRLPDLADLGCHLANELLVAAPHRHPRGCRHLEGDPLGSLDHHGVGEPESQFHGPRAFGHRPVAHAHDLQLLAEAR